MLRLFSSKTVDEESIIQKGIAHIDKRSLSYFRYFQIKIVQPDISGLHSAFLPLPGSRTFILVLQGIELISHRQRHRAGGELIIVGLKHRACVQSAVAVIRPQKVIDVQLQYQAFVKQRLVKGQVKIMGSPYDLYVSHITLRLERIGHCRCQPAEVEDICDAA